LRAQFGDIVGPRDTLLQLLKERAVTGAIRGAGVFRGESASSDELRLVNFPSLLFSFCSRSTVTVTFSRQPILSGERRLAVPQRGRTYGGGLLNQPARFALTDFHVFSLTLDLSQLQPCSIICRAQLVPKETVDELLRLQAKYARAHAVLQAQVYLFPVPAAGFKNRVVQTDRRQIFCRWFCNFPAETVSHDLAKRGANVHL